MKSPLFSSAGLASASSRHPWRIFSSWIVVLILAGVAATGLGDAFTTEINFANRPESVRADDLLKERLRGPRPVTETVLVHSETMTIDTLAFRQVVEATTDALLAMPEIVASASNYFQAAAVDSPAAPGLISSDRKTTIIPVTLVGDVDAAEQHVDSYLAVIHAQGRDGVDVLTVGDLSINEAFNTTASEDLRSGESFGLLSALVILVIVFGSLVAAGVPLVLAMVAIFVAVGLTALLGRVMDLSFFIVNMITMIGLAVGIDYSLFIVERYREERRHGHPTQKAIEIAGGTASKAVVFSGGTVVLALFGLYLIPTVLFRSLATGAVLVVIVAVMATLTLIPALLSVLGDRIDWPRRRRYDATAVAAQSGRDEETIHAGFWGRIARTVTARPVVSASLAASLLIAAALPYFNMKTGQAGVESLPPSDVKSAYILLSEHFPEGLLAPVEVVVDAPKNDDNLAAIDRLVASLTQDPVYGPADLPQWNDANDLALLRVPLTVSSNSPEAQDAVSRLRTSLVPRAFTQTNANVQVGGGPAITLDFNSVVDTWTPIVFAFVLGLSFMLLMLAFRSLVVPAKAIIMNVLSVGATYGIMVLVFQKGYGADLFGFQRTPVIETWIPIFLFCVLFGLSMDYHVFLLSRIREHYDLTHRNTESVAVGLQATGKIITGAALIMVAVFSGFAAGQLVMFQQMGFGLAVAVFLDATLVRTVLVPATMALLGDRNWYLPSWLQWLPDLRVERTDRTLAGRGRVSPVDTVLIDR